MRVFHPRVVPAAVDTLQHLRLGSFRGFDVLDFVIRRELHLDNAGEPSIGRLLALRLLHPELVRGIPQPLLRGLRTTAAGTRAVAALVPARAAAFGELLFDVAKHVGILPVDVHGCSRGELRVFAFVHVVIRVRVLLTRSNGQRLGSDALGWRRYGVRE